MTILWPSLRAGCLLAIAGLTLLASTPTSSADPDTKQKAAAAKDKVQQLCGIRWQPSVAAAMKLASRPGQEKPIMVFRVLGDLDGFM